MTEKYKTPEHQAVYETLRERILLGHYGPGEPLTIQGLTRSLNAGMTPVREAIRRLTSESALESLGNRRVIIPKLTAEQLQDIYFLRLFIEPELAARAAITITKEEISALKSIDLGVHHAIHSGDVETFLKHNAEFHFTIYGHAASPVLSRTVGSLWVQCGPSQRVICGRYGTSNLPDKHTELLSALSQRDPDLAAQAMRGDLQQGLDLIKQTVV